MGDSLVEFAKAKGVDVVAVGSRGMGSMKRSLMSLVGLGSVSDYVLHQLHVPVLVVHAGAAAAAAAPQSGQVRQAQARVLCVYVYRQQLAASTQGAGRQLDSSWELPLSSA